jgi:hypothetical protein
VQCAIKEISGETRVRTLTTYSGMAEFHTFNANEIRAKLREPGTQKERIFAAHEGNLSWQFELPPLAQTI